LSVFGGEKLKRKGRGGEEGFQEEVGRVGGGGEENNRRFHYLLTDEFLIGLEGGRGGGGGRQDGYIARMWANTGKAKKGEAKGGKKKKRKRGGASVVRYKIGKGEGEKKV